MIEYDSYQFTAVLLLSMLVSFYGLFNLGISVAGAFVVFVEVLILLLLVPYCVTNIRQTINRYTEQ